MFRRWFPVLFPVLVVGAALFAAEAALAAPIKTQADITNTGCALATSITDAVIGWISSMIVPILVMVAVVGLLSFRQAGSVGGMALALIGFAESLGTLGLIVVAGGFAAVALIALGLAACA